MVSRENNTTEAFKLFKGLVMPCGYFGKSSSNVIDDTKPRVQQGEVKTLLDQPLCPVETKTNTQVQQGEADATNWLAKLPWWIQLWVNLLPLSLICRQLMPNTMNEDIPLNKEVHTQMCSNNLIYVVLQLNWHRAAV